MSTEDDDLFGQYRRLEHELDRMFAELAGGRSAARATGVRAMADVWLADDPPRVIVQLDIAGVDSSAVSVEIDGDLLVVRGERHRPVGDRRVYHHAEIEWGRFERRLRVGAPVDVAAARADYQRGMLTIELPLAARPEPEIVRITLRGDA